MSEKGMFKKGLFGFRKKQVLGYIYELTAEHKAELDALTEEKEAAENEIEKLKSEIEEKEIEISEAKEENEKTMTLLEGVTNECAAHKEEIALLTRRVKYYSDRHLQTEREIAKARETAEKINLEAKAKADEIIRRSREYTQMVEANIELIKKDAEEIRSDIRESLSKLEESLSRLDEIGAYKKPEIEVPTYSSPKVYKKPEKTTRSILAEIKNIFRGVGY